jgi:transposase
MNASSLVSEDLWEAIEPLLPKEPPTPKGGRPRVPDRVALSGIVFALRTGCPWRLLPKELGCGSGTTCWRRLRDWQEAGVWQKLHERLLNWLGDEAAIDWSRASVDSLSVRAKRGANRQDQTRRIAASPAPSTTWSLTTTASLWPCGFRRPMPTTRPSCSRWSTPSLQSSAQEENRGDPASVRPNSTPTRPTIPRISAVPSMLEASRRELLGGALTPRSGLAAIAGWWSARSPGCSAVAVLASATSGGPTCSKGSCTWPAP